MTCPINASAGLLLTSCLSGRFRMTPQALLIDCISMFSEVRLMALSVSLASGVGLVRVNGVRWLRRKWSR